MPSADPQSNHLIAALPREVMERWLPQLHLVHLELGQVLYESGTNPKPRLLPDHVHRLIALSA
jgi:hypothetical protein